MITLSFLELALFGIGMWLVLDGLLYSLIPGMMEAFFRQMPNMDRHMIFQLGLASMALGGLLIYLSLN